MTDAGGRSGDATDTAASDIAEVGRVLRSKLGNVATAHARSALSAYRDGVYETFYVEAGIALELAMKAKLAGISPYLLAPDNQSWFKHGQQFAKGVTTGSSLKSVSADSGRERLEAIAPSLMAGISAKIEETVTRRDQSVHMGAFEQPSDEDLLTHVAAFVEAIHALLLTTPADFWGDLGDLASQLVADERDVVSIRVATKKSTAQRVLTLLDGEQQDAFEDAALTYFNEYKDGEQELVTVDCPVCQRTGLGTGELIDDGEPDFDWNPDGVITHWIYDINTILTGFECKVCRLVLSGADEVSAAGLPSKVSNDHADPSLMYEPDWDRD